MEVDNAWLMRNITDVNGRADALYLNIGALVFGNSNITSFVTRLAKQ